MSRSFAFPATFFAVFCIGCCSSSLLAQQDKSKATEYKLPKFETTHPQFCFLSVPSGPDRLTTVLIAIDGSQLYIDRNANHDLTDANELIKTKKDNRLSDRDLRFVIGDFKIGDRLHKSIELNVTPLENRDRDDLRIKKILKQNPKANSYQLFAEIEDDRFRGKGIGGRIWVMAGDRDVDGILQFGNELSNAPTIRMGGKLEIRLYSEIKLRPGAAIDVVAAVGMKGEGAGTFAAMGYDDVIPKSFHPRVLIDAVSKDEGDPVPIVHDLDLRC